MTEDPFRQEFRAFFFAPFLDIAREKLPPGRLEEILDGLGVAERQLRDPSTWVSLEFCSRACEALDKAIGDPSLFYRGGRLAFTHRYMGMLRPIIRAFGSPSFAFRQMVSNLPRFNQVTAVEIETLKVEGRRGRITLTFGPLPEGPREKTRYICAARIGQIAAMPTLFDMAPAKVEHPECMQDGSAVCRYHATWVEPAPRRPQWLAALGSMGLVGAAAHLVGLSLPVSVVGAGLAGVASWSVLQAHMRTREIAARIEDVSSLQDALVQTARENEARFVELLESKEAVDEQVQVRTRELAETGQRLEATLEDMRRVSRQRDQFFANVSHDLKTPMQLLLGPIDDMLEGREPAGGTQNALRIMRKNAARQLSLVEQLLQLASVDAGAPNFELRNVPITALLHRVTEAYRTVAEAQNVTLAVDAAPMEPVAADRFWLESALDNLVSNAFRFVEPGGRIDVSSRVVGGRLEIAVQDDGPGIPTGDLDKVFDRFAQAKDARARRGGGVGLGLAIVYETARLHEGEAEVESAPDGGARFVMRLPLRDASTLPVSDSWPNLQATLEHEVAAVDQPLPRRPGTSRVLVVEDHPEVRQLIAHIIARRYDVETAPDGAAALEVALRYRPDAIVSDVSMPEVDGFELCRRIRSEPRLRSTPIILLTANTGTGPLIEGLRAGADDYVAKPFSGEELLARVDAQLRTRRLMIELGHSNRLASLGTMATSLAHQIRNPLNALLNGAMLMGEPGRVEGDARKQLLEVVKDSAGRIERLTNDLMTFARDTQESKRQLILPAIERTVRLMSLQGGRDVKLHVEPGVEVLQVDLREAYLGHVLTVLIDNAHRAVGEGGQVELHARLVEGHLHLEVLDDGPGIPAEDLEKVFEPFYTTRRAGEGTGLGLALARQLAGELGGTITARRREPGGTSMLLTLGTLRNTQ